MWTNADPLCWSMYAALGGDELINEMALWIIHGSHNGFVQVTSHHLDQFWPITIWIGPLRKNSREISIKILKNHSWKYIWKCGLQKAAIYSALNMYSSCICHQEHTPPENTDTSMVTHLRLQPGVVQWIVRHQRDYELLLHTQHHPLSWHSGWWACSHGYQCVLQATHNKWGSGGYFTNISGVLQNNLAKI